MHFFKDTKNESKRINRINNSFNNEFLSKTPNSYIDFSRSENANSKPETIRENVRRKRKLSSTQQDLFEYKSDSSNEEMIRSRWKVTCLADPNVNLTVSNYRKGLFGDNRPPPRREFIPDVTLEKTVKYNDRDEQKKTKDELLKKDLQSLNERIESINEKYDLAKVKVNSDFKAQYEHNFNEECYKFNQIVLNQLEESRRSEIDSFKDLFESGEYKKGFFYEYTTLEIYQPSAKRRKYDDDGFRRTVLPQRLIDCIRLENELYQRFYDKPN